MDHSSFDLGLHYTIALHTEEVAEMHINIPQMLFLLGKSDVLHFEKFTQLSDEYVVLNHTMTSVGGRLLRKIARI